MSGWDPRADIASLEHDIATPKASALAAVCVLLYLTALIVGAWWLLAAVVDGWTS